MSLHYNLHAHFAPFCPKLYILRLQKQENRKQSMTASSGAQFEAKIDFFMISRIFDLVYLKKKSEIFQSILILLISDVK